MRTCPPELAYRTSLQKIETRKQTIEAGEISIIASYFGVSVSFFYKGEPFYMAYLPIRDIPDAAGYLSAAGRSCTAIQTEAASPFTVTTAWR